MKKTLLVGAAFASFISCQTYEPVELNPQEILNEIETQRSQELDLDEFTFAQAAKTMDENNLRLQQIRQKYQGLQKVADIKTPWPNPSLTTGPAKGSRLEGTSASSTQGFVGIAFNIPLAQLSPLRVINSC